MKTAQAGGYLGLSVLEALNKESQFTVSILSRKSSKSTYPSHNKVYAVSDTYPEEELLEAFKGQDAIVSTINAFTKQAQRDMIDMAVKAGVKHFIPSEFVGNTLNLKSRELVPMLADKYEVIQYLREQESKGLSWTGVVTGPFFDWSSVPYPPTQINLVLFYFLRGLQTGVLGFSIPTHTATIYDSGNTRIDTTTLPTIGTAVVKVLLQPSRTANRFIYISSFTTSQNEILAALETASGAKWEVRHEMTEALTTRGRERLEKGDMSAVPDLMVATVYGKDRGSAYNEEEELANEMLGLPKESLEEVVKELLNLPKEKLNLSKEN
ncbi:MAG: hypothetical protein Q9187_009530 [Circinaria calcarea]